MPLSARSRGVLSSSLKERRGSLRNTSFDRSVVFLVYGLQLRPVRADIKGMTRLERATSAAVVVITFWVLSRADLLADVPFASIVGLLACSVLLSTITMRLVRTSYASLVKLHVGIALQMGAVAVLIYATGLGPVLAVVFFIVVVGAVRIRGYSAAHPATLWALLALLAGQIAIELEWAPSVIDERLLRGVTALNALGLVFAGSVLASALAEKEVSETQLWHRSLHDPLTGLANRTLLVDYLGQALERAQKGALTLAVFYINLDRFKVVNDSLGHVVGDQLLVGVAERLLGCLRHNDVAARPGGDEFVLIIEDVSTINGAANVAERVFEAIGMPFELGDHSVVTTASMGIALSTTGQVDPEPLLRAAHLALQEAKQRGRGRYEVFSSELWATAHKRLELELELRKALDEGQLEVYYQPLVSLGSGGIVDMEALVRWNHPTRGLVPPLDFIPLAEETGLIVPLGRWVLEQACRQTKEWQEQIPTNPPLMVSVNLSGRQLQHSGLIDDIIDVLRETRLAPEHLRLEITESVLMVDLRVTIAQLSRLQGLGVMLAIDDFGTGYSSFDYLKRFPVETIKIDKSFVDGLGEDSNDSAIIQSVISLAHALKMTVVAEGVEKVTQLEELRVLGCDRFQGYLFARPMPAKDAGALIRSESLGAKAPELPTS